MRLYFARHGESQANLLREISNRGLKHPLTSKGRAQAAALAEKLAGEGISRIYSSPVLRALETSILLAQRLGVEYEVNEALREYDMGFLEGRSDDGVWETWQTFFNAWSVGKRLDEGVQGGETFRDIEKRFVPFLRSLIERFGATEERILCLAHGGIYWMMLPLVVINLDRAALTSRGGLKYTDCLACELRPQGLVAGSWI